MSATATRWSEGYRAMIAELWNDGRSTEGIAMELNMTARKATMSDTIWIILGGAVATYLTRIGGHLVLSRFETLHPRVEAALNAVPAAVLTTLVAPSLLSAGPKEMAALLVAGIVALRCGLMTMFLTGAALLIVLRNFT